MFTGKGMPFTFAVPLNVALSPLSPSFPSIIFIAPAAIPKTFGVIRTFMFVWEFGCITTGVKSDTLPTGLPEIERDPMREESVNGFAVGFCTPIVKLTAAPWTPMPVGMNCKEFKVADLVQKYHPAMAAAAMSKRFLELFFAIPKGII
jgi:hypothetical protein